MAIAAGALVFATAGAAAPLLIMTLAGTGLGIGITGGGLSFGGYIHEKKSQEVFEKLEKAIKDDVEALEKIQCALLFLDPEGFASKVAWTITNVSTELNACVRATGFESLTRAAQDLLPFIGASMKSEEASDFLQVLVQVACRPTPKLERSPLKTSRTWSRERPSVLLSTLARQKLVKP